MKNIDVIMPIFNITDDDKKMIKEIEKKILSIEIYEKDKKDRLLIKSRVRSVYSSLAIEANSLSLNIVNDIINNKTVLGKRTEIQEVKNANELYLHMKKYNWKSEKDFLEAHTILMKYFDDDDGYYRTHGEGIKKDGQIIYMAPESVLVPSLMKSLFAFINDNDGLIHPLILSAIFHYYFVYIHPFSDGNGRMARFWVTLMLTDYNPKFEYMPLEEELYLNQIEYYKAISECHINGNANVFISFMLKMIKNTLDKTTQKTTQKRIKLNESQLAIIKFIKENPSITRKMMADKLNISSDGVKYNITKLVKNNIIRRVGPDNGGYWQILDNDIG